jgi:hypothetical protein
MSAPSLAGRTVLITGADQDRVIADVLECLDS